MFVLLCVVVAASGFAWLAGRRYWPVGWAGAGLTVLACVYAQIAEPNNTRDTVPLLAVAILAHALCPFVRRYLIDFDRYSHEREKEGSV